MRSASGKRSVGLRSGITARPASCRARRKSRAGNRLRAMTHPRRADPAERLGSSAVTSSSSRRAGIQTVCETCAGSPWTPAIVGHVMPPRHPAQCGALRPVNPGCGERRATRHPNPNGSGNDFRKSLRNSHPNRMIFSGPNRRGSMGAADISSSRPADSSCARRPCSPRSASLCSGASDLAVDLHLDRAAAERGAAAAAGDCPVARAAGPARHLHAGLGRSGGDRRHARPRPRRLRRAPTISSMSAAIPTIRRRSRRCAPPPARASGWSSARRRGRPARPIASTGSGSG